MNSYESNALQFGLLLVFLVLYILRHFVQPVRRSFSWVLAVLVLFAFLAHIDFFRGDDARSRLQNTNFYHRFMGAKYFDELGYAGLYRASVVAEFENGAGALQQGILFRSLDGNHLIPRAEALADRDVIKNRFARERWTAFLRDIADFQVASPEMWEEGVVYSGHGYEGTPLTTTLNGGIANWLGWAPSTFMSWGVAGETLMLGLLALLVGAMLGADTAWVFLFFWYVNPFNDTALLGGASFRSLDLMLLSLALATFVRGWRFLGGGILAAATLLNPLYALFFAVFVLHDILAGQRGQAFRENRLFYIVFALMTAALVVGTSRTTTSGDAFRWKAYATHLSNDAYQPRSSIIGAAAPIILEYSISGRTSGDRAETGEAEIAHTLRWARDLADGLRAHREYYLGVAGMLALVTLIFLRVVPAAAAAFGGIVFAYLLFALSHEWFAVLAVVPLIFSGRKREVFFLTLALLWVTSFGLFPEALAEAPLRYLWASTGLGFFCLVVVLGGLWGWSPAPGTRRVKGDGEGETEDGARVTVDGRRETVDGQRQHHAKRHDLICHEAQAAPDSGLAGVAGSATDTDTDTDLDSDSDSHSESDSGEGRRHPDPEPDTGPGHL